MSGVILLSSSDEDSTDEPPRKRIKPTQIEENIEFKPIKTSNGLNADAVIISSDDETERSNHQTTFLSSSNFCKTENAELQENSEAAEQNHHNSISTDNYFNVNSTNLENNPAYRCNTVVNSCLEPLTNAPLDGTNEIRIANVFTSHIEDGLSTPLQDTCVLGATRDLRLENVFTSHVEDSFSTSLPDVSHIESTNKLRIDNVFASHIGDGLSMPMQGTSHVESTKEFHINNVCTSHVKDSSSTPLQDGSHTNDSLYASTHSNNFLDTLHTSVLSDNLPQKESIPQSKLDRSSPCSHTSEDKLMSENKMLAKAAAKPLDNETTVDEMDAFLKTCLRSVKKTKYESLREKFSVLNELYQKYILNKGYNDEVGSFLAEHITEASKSAADAVLTFNEVLEYFKTANIEEVEIAPEYKKKVKVLLKTCLKLIHRIKQLECAEVEWDDDENSAYIQEDRYKKRLVKVFNLYCKYVKINPYQGRLTHKKLHFSASNYKEINAALNKNCQKNEKFPSYKDIEHIVRKCVNKYDLPLSESKIQRESERCFKTVGRFLQKRRKQELYESHFYFIKDSNDPASIDKQLDKCLKHNFAEGMKKIEMICERYAEKQMEQSQTQQSEDDTASESSSNEESDSS